METPMAKPHIAIIDTPKRKNGFQLPLNVFQILINLMVIENIIIYLVVTKKFVEHDIIHFVAGLLLLVTIISGYIATATNPEDKLVLEQKRCLAEGIPFDDTEYGFYCHICESCVMQGSKHCRTCNKCVLNFDHHCRWLNNCIGS